MEEAGINAGVVEGEGRRGRERERGKGSGRGVSINPPFGSGIDVVIYQKFIHLRQCTD